MSDQDFQVKEEVKASGISHTFDSGYAIEYGLDEAVMIRHLQFFITANANRGHNFHEERFWTYDRLEDFPAHFPYWSVKQIRRILASLIEQRVIIKGEFNSNWSNRTRWYAFNDQDKFIKNIKIPKTPLPMDLHLPKRATDSFQNGQLTNAQMGNCINDTSTIAVTITNTNSLEVLETQEQVVNHLAAKAAEEILIDSSKEKSKRARSPSIFSPKVKEIADKMLSILTTCNPVYRPPDNLEKFLYQVQMMLEKDNQDPEVLLKTFQWACSDSEQRENFKGWQSVICTNKRKGKASTPAEIFRGHFATIYSQMNSREKRKFAPSSNDARSLEKWDEAMKGAL